MQTFRFSLLLSASFLLTSPSSHADWEANFSATSSKKEFAKASGKVFLKEEMIRVDLVSPAEFNLYAKSGATRVDATVPSFRIRLTSKIDRFAGQIPTCLVKSFEACVKRYNLKKLGEEKCGDRSCEVYLGSGISKDLKKIQIWHWKGESEAVIAKSIITKKDGSEIRTEFTNIARKSRDPSFFVVPTGYANAGTLERFLGDLKGQSE